MKNTIYPELVNQMKLHKQGLQEVADLLNIKYKEQISRRLSGKVEWTIGEVETLCNYYNMGFWELFRRKENKNENI